MQAPDSGTLLMPVSSVPLVSDRLELHNNNWASGSQHPGPSESDVYSDVIQEARSNDLLHMVRLSVRLDTPLHGNNARGAKHAVYYASVVTHTVFENIKWLRSVLCWNRNVAVPSLARLFPDIRVLWLSVQLHKKVPVYWPPIKKHYEICTNCIRLSPQWVSERENQCMREKEKVASNCS